METVVTIFWWILGVSLGFFALYWVIRTAVVHAIREAKVETVVDTHEESRGR